jgi:hypothetical protein
MNYLIFKEANKRPKSVREKLFLNLRKKIHETAKENYCTQIKINSADLQLKLKITEKCRFFLLFIYLYYIVENITLIVDKHYLKVYIKYTVY